MLKNLLSLSKDELNSILHNPITIYEKLDLIYFKVEITKKKIFIYKTPYFKCIDSVDILCNSIYKDINQFVDTLSDFSLKILEIIGECKIGFFYMPDLQTKVINYYTWNKTKFILSDLYTKDKSKNNIDVLYSIIETITEPVPKIGNYVYTDLEINKMQDSIVNSNLQTLVSLLLKTNVSYTGLPISEIEGIVIISNNKKYQIQINNTKPNIDKSITKIYRDTVLTDFIHIILTDSEYINTVCYIHDSYVSLICELFSEYINRTELFTKFDIEPVDLEPPHVGYIGSMDIDNIPVSTARILCKYNKLSENILKILLYCFRNINIKKYNKFNERDINLLQWFIDKIKFKLF